MFRFNRWYRFKTLESPFAAISVIWNSMMSWAGGWFYLMAAEIFTVGKRNFQLPGLGAYLRAAADAGDMRSLVIGIFVLVLVIVLLDQLIWRPLLAWSDRFKVDTVGSDNPPTSWFYDFWQRSPIMAGWAITCGWVGHICLKVGKRLPLGRPVHGLWPSNRLRRWRPGIGKFLFSRRLASTWLEMQLSCWRRCRWWNGGRLVWACWQLSCASRLPS